LGERVLEGGILLGDYDICPVAPIPDLAVRVLEKDSIVSGGYFVFVQ